MLKLRMSLNMQKTLTLPKNILKPESQQKEKQIKEYTGSTIRKNSNSLFIFFSDKETQSAWTKYDISKTAKIGSKKHKCIVTVSYKIFIMP